MVTDSTVLAGPTRLGSLGLRWIDSSALVRTNSEHQRGESPKGKVMSEAGREPSRADARSFTMIEEIASAYLTEADGDLASALRQAIRDALAALVDMESRAHRAEGLI